MIIHQPKEICTKFNKYFVNCIEQIITQNNNPNPNNLPFTNNILHTFNFWPSHQSEILNIIESLKKNAAAGSDEISTKFCIFIKESLSCALSKIIAS